MHQQERERNPKSARQQRETQNPPNRRGFVEYAQGKQDQHRDERRQGRPQRHYHGNRESIAARVADHLIADSRGHGHQRAERHGRQDANCSGQRDHLVEVRRELSLRGRCRNSAVLP
jgi:hypothetical protein